MSLGDLVVKEMTRLRSEKIKDLPQYWKDVDLEIETMIAFFKKWRDVVMCTSAIETVKILGSTVFSLCGMSDHYRITESKRKEYILHYFNEINLLEVQKRLNGLKKTKIDPGEIAQAISAHARLAALLA